MLSALITKITIMINNNKKGAEETFGVVDMPMTFVVVTVSQVYTH